MVWPRVCQAAGLHLASPLLPGLAVLKEMFHCDMRALAQAQGARPGQTGPVPSQPGTQRGAGPGCLNPAQPQGRGRDGSALGGNVPPGRDAECRTAQGTGCRPSPCSTGMLPRWPRESVLEGGQAGRQALAPPFQRSDVLSCSKPHRGFRRTEQCPGGWAPQNPQGVLQLREGREGSSGKMREGEGLRVTWPRPLGTPRGVEPLHPWPAILILPEVRGC